MKTTVIIPNYNGLKFLENCLQSATKSTVKASVMVVDNGSDDGSGQWLLENYPDVRVLSLPENRGFSGAVNAGIRSCNTPYVFLLNNDTRIEPDCIKRLEEAMEADSRIFSVGARMLSMSRPKEVDTAGDLYSAFGWALSIGKGRPDSRYNRPARVFSNCAGAALYRKEYLDQTGLFDEAHFVYLEDVDLGWRARIRGYLNVTQPLARVYHAGSGSSGSRYNAFKITHSSRNNIYLIYKNMPLLQLFINLPFLLAGFLIKTVFFAVKGYGGIYVKGLAAGVRLCMSPAGRQKKVRFQKKYLKNYLRIQLELWVNLLRQK